ncbi:hypothetical protein BJ982_003318 [Sphaerisporangium siamense]|uniref:Uncharacterized protein n=1 Tax=Sphaerisporangium siamense TaxID=795645 RepID=A0A7W7D7L2_9ACTN|nr:hypothetical protein [Sphaerisporangium siamense]MBB4701774.1 hypothetical protein [Sphaerisporangium siamense]
MSRTVVITMRVALGWCLVSRAVVVAYEGSVVKNLVRAAGVPSGGVV